MKKIRLIALTFIFTIITTFHVCANKYHNIYVNNTKLDIKIFSDLNIHNGKTYVSIKFNDSKSFLILSTNALYNIENNNLYISNIPSKSTNFFLIKLTNKNTISEILPLNLDKNNFLILVNQKNPLSKNFTPYNLTTYNNYKLDKSCALMLDNMLKDASKQGIKNFVIKSGYRSYKDQSILYNSYLNKFKKLYPKNYLIITSKYIQKPGCSEHQTGLAVDISSKDIHKYKSFENTPQYKWLYKNSWKYGFILRYPKNKTYITKINFEPWHFRFVGFPNSEYIYKNNLTLEEYIKLLRSNKFIIFKTHDNQYFIITLQGYKKITP
ncbi:D-alanyl-D-alanine carboxypeptidase [Caloramator fervidus]|uniref:D-alanyl-D-alanine carboxypeptidase n=1 Tax=Caloramator fervidus TaxID=29344 RepID=A0A1H5WBU9_9CLOT|nr:M15 family metallopeptidase [Caloramator fervidus]SEF96935.1 D-alanyl-D-alanine carboxypeptidase [Caloramator fervidus]